MHRYLYQAFAQSKLVVLVMESVMADTEHCPSHNELAAEMPLLELVSAAMNCRLLQARSLIIR
jgi:hypothetical protein